MWCLPVANIPLLLTVKRQHSTHTDTDSAYFWGGPLPLSAGSQVGHQLVAAYASCTGLPLVRHRIGGHAHSQALAYQQTAGDEVEDLYTLLAFVKVRRMTDVGCCVLVRGG